VAEVSFNIISTASRYRAANESLRARDQTRQDNTEATARRANEVQQRNEIAQAEAQRKAGVIRDRRNINEDEIAQSLKFKGQQQVLDSIDSDTRFRRLRDDVTSELNQARGDEAAAKHLIDSEAEEALALDAIQQNPDRTNEGEALRFQSFLSDRSERLTLRQQQERDFSVQQQIDQRISDDNLRSVRPDNSLPRGSIVDVSG